MDVAARTARTAGWAFTFVMLAVMLTTVTVRQGHQEFPGPTLLVFSVLAWLPLLIRTYRPLTALVGTVVAESLHLAVVPFVDPGLQTPIAMGAYQPVPLATMAAAFTLASRVPQRLGWTAGGSAAAVLLAVSLLTRPHSLLATDIVMTNLVLLATAAGAVISGRRDRRDREARERVDEKENAVLDERLRIARELHDALAHNLTLVNAQAGVADYLLRTDPAAAAVALRDISRHTGRALDELRATIGLLRREGDDPASSTAPGELLPTPGLDELDTLLAGFRSAGATIDLVVTGPPASLGQHGDLAAYRIVQEALTNATKHAPGVPVRVRLAWSSGRLDVDVANDGPAVARAHPAPGTGHGLIGMRERALAAGGTLRAGPAPGGGFTVSATLPAEESADDAGPGDRTTTGGTGA